MELKYKLESWNHRQEAGKSIWTFVYKPTLEEYKNVCTFTVKTSSPDDSMLKLNLPETIGDIIVMDFKPKNVQTGLKKSLNKAS